MVVRSSITLERSCGSPVRVRFDREAPLWDGSLPLDSFRAVRVPATEAVGPGAEMPGSFDHLVGAGKQRLGNIQTQRLGRL